MADAGGPDWIGGDPAALRRWRDRRPEVLAPALPPDVTVAPLPAEGRCPGGLLFRPERPAGLPVVYFHGGGFVVGSPETHRIVAAWIAHLAQAPVFSIRYWLAPEHPLPAQAMDARAAILRQLQDHAALRLMGDSSGALVALWGFAALDDSQRKRVQDMLLIYPPAGLHPAPGPEDAAREADGLGPRSIAAMYARLDPAGRMPGDPRLDPLADGFPRAPDMTILAAGDDPVLPDARALAARHGARLIIGDGLAHGFLSSLPAGPAMALLRQALGAA